MENFPDEIQEAIKIAVSNLMNGYGYVEACEAAAEATDVIVDDIDESLLELADLIAE